MFKNEKVEVTTYFIGYFQPIQKMLKKCKNVEEKMLSSFEVKFFNDIH
jgi:hypothetical protein